MPKSNFEFFLDVVNFWSRCDSTAKSYLDTVQNKFVNWKFSNFQAQNLLWSDPCLNSPERKLIPTLNNKEEYVLHYRNLQRYTDLDLKEKKAHRVSEFNHSPWLRQYIEFNTQKRTQPKNSFEKDFFKLMNNSVFGKTMENLWKRVEVKLATDKKNWWN